MTTHYVDIALHPDPEISAAHLFGALYDRFHLALVHQRQDAIGISFPGYGMQPRTLGDVLRLHAPEAVLRAFVSSDWLGGMRDHVQVGEIAPAPDGVSQRTVARRQFKTNVERLRRRRMKRKGETAEEVAVAIPVTVERQPNLPYVHLHSRSTGQPFCLFICLGPLLEAASPGTFNSYGLSTRATIPWF